MKTTKTTMVFMFALLSTVWSVNAQNERIIERYQNVDELIEVALKNNPTLKVSELQMQQEQALKGASFDIPKAKIGLDYGQTNSIVKNDTHFSISQTFEFPTVYTNKSKLSRAKIEAFKVKKEVVKKELIAQVNSAYYQLWYAKHKQRLLKNQDSIYEKFAYAANLRFKTGESNALERATANAELAEIQILIFESATEVTRYKLQLKQLLNTKNDVDIIVGDLGIKSTPELLIAQDTSTTNSPIVQFYKAQVLVAEKEKAVQNAKMLPDISLGYFNQSFNGIGETANGTPTVFDSGDRFTGIQLGLSIPIFFNAHAAKIKAAKIHKLESEAILESVTNNTQAKIQTLIETLQMQFKNLDYYQKNALPQATLLLKQSQRGFEEGEIGYIEYVQGLNRALTIKTKHLAYVNQYNQTLIKTEQLISK